MVGSSIQKLVELYKCLEFFFDLGSDNSMYGGNQSPYNSNNNYNNVPSNRNNPTVPSVQQYQKPDFDPSGVALAPFSGEHSNNNPSYNNDPKRNFNHDNLYRRQPNNNNGGISRNDPILNSRFSSNYNNNNNNNYMLQSSVKPLNPVDVPRVPLAPIDSYDIPQVPLAPI